MATIIEQQPLYTTLPVGQDVMFSVSNSIIVANQIKVKFVAQVHISSSLAPNLSLTTDIVGTFKTTPNNAGVGMFDFRPIIESYVKADNLAKLGSEYKETTATTSRTYPIHLIDKYSGNDNSMRYFAIQFKVEYLDQDPASSTFNELVQREAENSELYKIFNGYLKYTDTLDQVGVEFGYHMGRFEWSTEYAPREFLTNASTIQYANIDDYGTLSMLNIDEYINILFRFYDSSGSPIGTANALRTFSNGAPYTWNADIGYEILHFGCYPGNLRNWSSTFQGIVSTVSYYTIQALEYFTSDPLTEAYRININCPTLKGFEPIRLTWLNQWGAWDYYTFNMKSVRKLSTKGSTYNQLAGTWNKSAYRIDSFKGGKKSFRVNATEKITMNTDFVNEAESEWFEELINSPEVYILEGFEDIVETGSALNQYVTPVRLTTSSYTRKTVANDKLMQYTFEVEKSKSLRTQSV